MNKKAIIIALLVLMSMEAKAQTDSITVKNDSITWSKELEDELQREDRERSEEELGDFLFSVINAARLYKLNPDNALEHTNQKFIRRFNYIEQHSIKVGRPLTEMTLEEMDALWNEAKRIENLELRFEN